MSFAVCEISPVDSLNSIITNVNSDTQKVNLLNAFGDSLFSKNDLENALLVINEAIAVSVKANYKYGMARSYRAAGDIYISKYNHSLALKNYYAALKAEMELKHQSEIASIYIAIAWVHAKGNYPEAIINFKSALKIAEEIHDTLNRARAHWGLSETYSVMGNYSEALTNGYAALKLFELLRNQEEMMIFLYSNLGYTFEKQNNFKEALNAYNSSLKLSEKTKNKIGIADASINVGQLFFNNDNYSEAYKKYLDALEIYKELDNQYRIAYSYERIGDLQEKRGDLFLEQDSALKSTSLYNDAFIQYQSALDIYTKIDYKIGVAETNTTIGNLCIKLKKFSAAKKYLFTGIEMAKNIDSKDAIKSAYKGLSDYYSIIGDEKLAFKNYKLYIDYRDSLTNEEVTKATVKIQMQYEFDKKEAATKAEQDKKDVIQQAQVQRLKVIRNSFIVGAALLLFILLGLINRYRFKQKANKELADAYENLKATQQQLIKSEKMAAFGIMASRLGHEIQNPLNFVNNFSEISDEVIDSIALSENEEERKEAAKTLKIYLEKINFHGKRAEKIVKQLQEHTRAGTAQKFFEDDKKVS